MDLITLKVISTIRKRLKTIAYRAYTVQRFNFTSYLSVMKLSYYKIKCLLFVVFVCISCRHPQKEALLKSHTALKIDTTKSFKVDTFWVTPKTSLQFNSLISSSNDTLDLVTCTEYVYSPFGILNDSSQLSKSLLKNFRIANITDSSVNNRLVLQSLKLKSSKLIVFFDHDPEASKESYIIKGEIYDRDVDFTKNIRIGMSENNFCGTFFKDFPSTLQKRYKVIVFQSCVEGIKHIYSFKDGELNSVKFECVKCSWKVDY